MTCSGGCVPNSSSLPDIARPLPKTSRHDQRPEKSFGCNDRSLYASFCLSRVEVAIEKEIEVTRYVRELESFQKWHVV